MNTQPQNADAEPARSDSAIGAISRRDFLNGILISGAALSLASFSGLLPMQVAAAGAPVASDDRTDDFSLCHRIWRGELTVQPNRRAHLYDCVIIGGGMSGLVAAWKLRELGVKDILVLEKDDVLGGLCRSDTIGGIVAAKASAYPSFPFNEDMIALYSDLGFIRVRRGKVTVKKEYVLQPPYDQLFSRGKWVSDPFDDAGIAELPVSQKCRDDLAALTAKLEELWAWEDAGGNAAFDCPPDDASRNRAMRGLDDMTLGEYARSQGWGLEMVRLFDPLLRSAYGVGHDRISAWAALDILSDELLPADPGEDWLGFPGGNAYFAESLVRKLDARQLLPKTIVSQIRQPNDEVQITCVRQGKAETLRARTAIFAAPQFMTPYLLPDLPADRQKAAKTFEYTPYVVANVAVSQTPPGLAYSNQLLGDFVMSDFIVADWTDARRAAVRADQPAQRAHGVLSADRGRSAAAVGRFPGRLAGQDSVRVRQVHPGPEQDRDGLLPVPLGPCVRRADQGAVFSPARQLVKRPIGRIFFAGADVEGIPTIDHAMASGFRTAEEVAAFLG